MFDGLERYPVSLRFETKQREDILALQNLQVKTKLGFQPLEMFANLKYEEGPSVIKSEKASVEVLKSDAKWFGVTYKEDKEIVQEAIIRLKNNNTYPKNLW